ncbi:MAG TPA: carbohydrate ABC transporter permease [Thermotogota bacterium]|nr:carbohydrate ABC transporter permease [Thermotogota bacterium]HRW92813.1 carbohydrate ABC transporter permease [Thermotogota bacterium]
MLRRNPWYVFNKTWINALFWILMIMIIYPLFWMIINSLKTSTELFINSFAMPEKPLFKNYVDAWNMGFADFFLNSILVTATSVAVTVLLSAFCAYALARLDIRFKNTVLYLIIGGLLLSPQSALISLYRIFDVLNIYNTYFAMIVPYIAFRIPFAVFLMYGYFKDFPGDLEDAARIDGCSTFKTFLKIVMPISKPILAATAIVSSIFTWNEFLFALVFIESENLVTIPVGLSRFRDALQTNWTGMMAGIIIASLPMIIAFLFMSKAFISGLTAGSVKG